MAPCSRTYSQPHGRVLSPSWPHRLPRNQKTLFELTINNIFHQESDVQLHNHSSNGPLRLSFLPLHGHRLFPQLLLLPPRGGNFSTNNNQQTSQVHDGATEAAPLLTRLCGRALPPSISSRFIPQDLSMTFLFQWFFPVVPLGQCQLRLVAGLRLLVHLVGGAWLWRRC